MSPSSPPTHPRYHGPVVDAHCHYDESTRRLAPSVNRQGGLLAAIHLWDIAWPPVDSRVEASAWSEQEPQLLRCHNPDLSGIGAAGFEAALERDLRDAARLGCVGVKVWKHLGLWLVDSAGERLAIDDERLGVLWETAAELGMPIAIHVGDPPAFFAPLDDDNPRIEELRVHPEWWYGGGDFASLDQIHDEFESLVAAHPGTTFIAVHFGCFMSYVEMRRMLTTYPNYQLDTAAAIADMGVGDVQAAREIITDFPTRVIFGTDLIRIREFDMPDSAGADRWDLGEFFAAHWRFFETAEGGLEHPLPAQGDWTVTGIDLPEDVLAHLYWANAADTFRLPGSIAKPERGVTRA
jgi:hypothetical protein